MEPAATWRHSRANSALPQQGEVPTKQTGGTPASGLHPRFRHRGAHDGGLRGGAQESCTSRGMTSHHLPTLGPQPLAPWSEQGSTYLSQVTPDPALAAVSEVARLIPKSGLQACKDEEESPESRSQGLLAVPRWACLPAGQNLRVGQLHLENSGWWQEGIHLVLVSEASQTPLRAGCPNSPPFPKRVQTPKAASNWLQRPVQKAGVTQVCISGR